MHLRSIKTTPIPSYLISSCTLNLLGIFALPWLNYWISSHFKREKVEINLKQVNWTAASESADSVI